MIGFSMMVVIVTGGLNLSVGAIGVCAAMAIGWLLERARPAARRLRFAGALALGGALGAVNGVLIVRSGLHSFIITLATMSIFFGVMVFISRAQAFRDLPPEICRFRQDADRRLRLGAAARQHRRRSAASTASTA